MRRGFGFILVVIIGLLAHGFAMASDFSWTVTCKWLDGSDRLHFWVGYQVSEDLPESQIAYLGNGPGIVMDMPKAGGDNRAVEVLLPDYNSEVTLFLYPDDVSITITNDTEAPDCDQGGGDGQAVTLDDQGKVNNPLVNERANTCYEPGQVCTTEAEWEHGWYLIREQYPQK